MTKPEKNGVVEKKKKKDVTYENNLIKVLF